MNHGFSRLVGKSIFLSAALFALSACNSLSLMAPVNFVSEPLAQDALEPAELPTYRAGDKFYYSNGARDTVVSVNGDDVEMINKNKRKSIYSRNPFQPYKYFESSTKHTTKNTDAVLGNLWPLSIGKGDKYISNASYITIQTGQAKDFRQIWECEVEGSERVTILAGNFDTYRVTCERYSDAGKRYQTRTWFYAPEIQSYVLRRDFYFSSKKERFRELTAIRPSLTDLERKIRNSIVRSWQDALENSRSGEMVSWSNKAGTIKAEVVPLSTFKAENGQYCRTYRQYLTLDGATRTYGGVACRTEKLKWRTPKRG